MFGALVDRVTAWNDTEVRLEENNKLRVTNLSNENEQIIELNEKVLTVTLAYGYLVVTGANNCHIYKTTDLNSPYKFDLKEKIKFVLTSPKYFALLEETSAVKVYSYEGKLSATLNIPFIKASSLVRGHISISNDTLAVINNSQPQLVKTFELLTGKQNPTEIEHGLEIVKISLNQEDNIQERKLCLLDNNRDLYVTGITQAKLAKITGMCDSFAWNDRNDMLCCLSDDKFMTWIYPGAVFLDKELLDGGKYEKDASDIGKNATITGFSNSTCTIARSNGCIAYRIINPYAKTLLETLRVPNNILKALKLCRLVKDKILWTAFSSYCLLNREINVAQLAVSNIDEVDKVNFIEKILRMREKHVNEAIIGANLLMLTNRVDEAEALLIETGFIYRAIKLNLDAFRWDKALGLAQEHNKHVDTVLGYRKKYLEGAAKEENNAKFLQLSKEIPVNWEEIKKNVATDKQKEH